MQSLKQLVPRSLTDLASFPLENWLKHAAIPVVTFNDGPFVENPPDGRPIHVRFMLKDQCHYEVTIQPGEWAKAGVKYAADWIVEITDAKGWRILRHAFNPGNRKVRINIDSKGLADTLAWLPQIERYKRKNPSTEVYVSQFWNPLGFAAQYPGLRFIEPDVVLEDCYATYNLGYYFDRIEEQHPEDPRVVPMIEVASDILGLEYEEVRPRITVENPERAISGPYVCITTSAGTQCKQWLFEGGWQTLIDRLNEMGFSVVLIQKDEASFDNAIDRTGDRPIQERITDLYHCEFFVGLSSGLSWLAWSLGKPVVLISGFSEPYAEFVDQCYRVMNTRACGGCWNDPSYTFDRGNRNWCPRHEGTDRQFECSTSIAPEMVLDCIDELLRDRGPTIAVDND